MKLHDYKGYIEHINEIEIKPIKTPYNIDIRDSIYYKNKKDYVLEFSDKNKKWIVNLICFIVNGMETYNIVFTPKIQWDKYLKKYLEYLDIYGNNIPLEKHQEMSEIITKPIGKTDMIKLFKKMSYVILDFCQNIGLDTFSIGTDTNEVKLRFYQSVIKDSFPNYNVSQVTMAKQDYLIYKV